jgi:hypothetical protein
MQPTQSLGLEGASGEQRSSDFKEAGEEQDVGLEGAQIFWGGILV